MELILNLAWALLAVVMGFLWLRFGLREGFSRKTQLVALAVLVLILFPVISVTDDLQAAQNPAEADCCVRRDYVVVSAHSILPAVIALFHPIMDESPLGSQHSAVYGEVSVSMADRPALAAIDNRPPPSA
jgi:hypothetical protein